MPPAPSAGAGAPAARAPPPGAARPQEPGAELPAPPPAASAPPPPCGCDDLLVLDAAGARVPHNPADPARGAIAVDTGERDRGSAARAAGRGAGRGARRGPGGAARAGAGATVRRRPADPRASLSP
jgi:hypothetical protein